MKVSDLVIDFFEKKEIRIAFEKEKLTGLKASGNLS